MNKKRRFVELIIHPSGEDCHEAEDGEKEAGFYTYESEDEDDERSLDSLGNYKEDKPKKNSGGNRSSD